MSDQVEQKQELLKTEILDKQYDIEHFTSYMEDLKPGGGQDIDVWQMDELISAVRAYQMQQQEILDQQNIMKQMQVEQQQKMAQFEQYISYKPDLNQDDNNFQKLVECNPIVPNNLGQSDNVKIEIKNFEKKAGSMFSSSYVIYKVITSPFDWEVQRRYTDFTWLRELLVKIYPGLNIPPVPRKSQTRNFQDLYLIKRMRFLEKFLNKLLKSQELLNDKYVEGFLSLADDKNFKQLMKDSEKVQRVSKLSQLTSSTGNVSLAINPQLNLFVKTQGEFLTSVEFLYKKVRKQSKQLLLDFDNIANTMYGMGETFAQLFNVSNNFNKNVPGSKIGQFDEMFITLNNMMIQWGNILQSQVRHVQENFSSFYKFYHHEILQYKDYLKQREQAQSEFEKYKQRLDLKKEKLFQGTDISRFELPPQLIQQVGKEELLRNKKFTQLLMLPKETSAQLDLRDIYGYYQNAAMDEFNRIQGQNIIEWSTHFIEFVKIQSDQVTQLHMLWADTLIILQAFGKSDSRQLQLMQGQVKDIDLKQHENLEG